MDVHHITNGPISQCRAEYRDVVLGEEVERGRSDKVTEGGRKGEEEKKED